MKYLPFYFQTLNFTRWADSTNVNMLEARQRYHILEEIILNVLTLRFNSVLSAIID